MKTTVTIYHKESIDQCVITVNHSDEIRSSKVVKILKSAIRSSYRIKRTYEHSEVNTMSLGEAVIKALSVRLHKSTERIESRGIELIPLVKVPEGTQMWHSPYGEGMFFRNSDQYSIKQFCMLCMALTDCVEFEGRLITCKNNSILVETPLDLKIVDHYVCMKKCILHKTIHTEEIE